MEAGLEHSCHAGLRWSLDRSLTRSSLQLDTWFSTQGNQTLVLPKAWICVAQTVCSGKPGRSNIDLAKVNYTVSNACHYTVAATHSKYSTVLSYHIW